MRRLRASWTAKLHELDGHSLVIAVYNGGEQFRTCLQAITSSAWTAMELIVVDEGLTDDSVAFARSFRPIVLSTGGRRRQASRQSRREPRPRRILVFLNADVAVHAGTLRL